MNNQTICWDRRLPEKKFMLIKTVIAQGHFRVHSKCDFGSQYPSDCRILGFSSQVYSDNLITDELKHLIFYLELLFFVAIRHKPFAFQHCFATVNMLFSLFLVLGKIKTGGVVQPLWKISHANAHQQSPP